MTRRRHGYREHKRNSRKHFERRWRERIECDPPPWDKLVAEFQNAMSSVGSTVLHLYSYQLENTRWLARMGGKDLVITYNHKLKQPVTVWVASSELEKKAHAELRENA